jgi:hypothetical protein
MGMGLKDIYEILVIEFEIMDWFQPVLIDLVQKSKSRITGSMP